MKLVSYSLKEMSLSMVVILRGCVKYQMLWRGNFCRSLDSFVRLGSVSVDANLEREQVDGNLGSRIV